jgi:TnpA family transposase
LENDTLLEIREHHTDTHGATEHLFGLCHLLGFEFMPRFKDIADQKLYKFDRATTYGRLDPFFALHDEQLRRRVQLQLNRDESRHDLARRLFFANRGVFRSGDYAEIMNKVSALSVLSNAVLVWNTVRIGAIVDELEAGGQPVSPDDLARVSPLLDAHVIATGSYHFDRAVRRARPQENQGAVA